MYKRQEPGIPIKACVIEFGFEKCVSFFNFMVFANKCLFVRTPVCCSGRSKQSGSRGNKDGDFLLPQCRASVKNEMDEIRDVCYNW